MSQSRRKYPTLLTEKPLSRPLPRRVPEHRIAREAVLPTAVQRAEQDAIGLVVGRIADVLIIIVGLVHGEDGRETSLPAAGHERLPARQGVGERREDPAADAVGSVLEEDAVGDGGG